MQNILDKPKQIPYAPPVEKQCFINLFEIIGDVRGRGPMLALELVKNRESKEPATEKTKELVRFCFDRGLILLICGSFDNVIRTLMPLVITDEQLDRGISILADGLKAVSKKSWTNRETFLVVV